MPSKKPTNKRQGDQRNLCELTPHPANEVFGDLPAAELQMLADDIAVNGLKHPIEILPNNTIVCGHQRVRALKLLGRTTTPCIVRYDLENAHEEHVIRRLIADNVTRRQLKPLGLARALVATFESELREDDLFGRTTELVPQLAALCNMSERNARRYLSVLKTPRPVQDALEGGALQLQQAASVASQPPDKQQRIAKQILKGVAPQDAVLAVMRRQTDPAWAAAAAERRCVERTVQAMDALAERVKSGLPLHPDCRGMIDESIHHLTELLVAAGGRRRAKR